MTYCRVIFANRHYLPICLFASAGSQFEMSKTIDNINTLMSFGTHRYAAMDAGSYWCMNQQSRSKKYSINWQDLLVINLV
jgi:hypothetical protein